MQFRLPQAPVDAGTTCLRVELTRRNWTTADIAQAAGIPFNAARDIIAARSLCERNRHRIERALGLPVWTDHEEFKKRSEFIQKTGFDPYGLTVSKLRALAKQKEITLPGDISSRQKILNRIIEATATHAPSKHKSP